MTGKERLLNALRGQEVDRTPVTLFIQGQGHFITQVYPETDSWDFPAIQKNVIDFQRKMKVDVHVRMLFFLPHNPVFLAMGGLNMQTQTEDWQIEIEEDHKGNTKLLKTTITTPEGQLKQTFSINELRDGTFMYAITEKPINSREDLALAVKYEPALDDKTKEAMGEVVKEIKGYLGDDGIVSSWTNGGIFNNLSGIIDHNLIYSLFLIDRDYYDDLMKFAQKRVFDYTRLLADIGVEALCVGGNVAGGFLGSSFFEEYVLPYEQAYMAFVDELGLPVIYHNCGEIMELVEAYQKMGAHNIEPFSPHPLGDGDLKQLAACGRRQYSVTGGVDQVNVIQNGNPELVIEKTEKTMAEGRHLDSFIIQNADFLEYGTPVENVEAFVATALRLATKASV